MNQINLKSRHTSACIHRIEINYDAHTIKFFRRKVFFKNYAAYNENFNA